METHTENISRWRLEYDKVEDTEQIEREKTEQSAEQGVESETKVNPASPDGSKAPIKKQ
jgi:hypothetical protein